MKIQKIKKIPKQFNKKSHKKRLYALLHEAVRLRDNEQCLKCHRRDTLQLSHIYPKGKHRKLEFELDNLKLLCYACHIHWFHKSPIEAHEWLQQVIPQERLQRLKLLANTVQYGTIDYAALELWLEQEIKRLKVTKEKHEKRKYVRSTDDF